MSELKPCPMILPTETEEINALRKQLKIAVEVLEGIATYPAVINIDFKITIAELKRIAREALKKLEVEK